MEEESQSNKLEEEKLEIINLENDNFENSTEHANRPVINIEKNDLNINEQKEENLKLIQDRINQEINSKELEEINLKKNSKENSSLKGHKKFYNNLEISNNNFFLSKESKTSQKSKKIKMNNYIHKNNNINNTESKYIKYDDELKRYYFNKEFSNLHISTEENFLERMKFDIYKRQIREKKIDDFVEHNKVKIKEEKKIKTFNHLIEDANRRLKAQIHAENLNTQLSQDLMSKNVPKKYNEDEWDIIYKKRFKNYLDRVNQKKKENKMFYEEEKKKKEEEILKLLPNKKASNKHIKEISDKMYEEAMKRNIKKKEIIENFYNIKLNELSIKKDIKIQNKENLNNENNNNILSKFLNNANNLKNFNNKLKNNKSTSKIINKNKADLSVQNFINNHSQDKNVNINKNLNKNDEDNYNLEKERQLLIQMSTTKKLPREIINNNDLNNMENLDIKNSQSDINIDNKEKLESEKIIDEFFMRHLI